MMPLEDLDGDALLIRVGQIGKRCVINLAEDSRYLSKFCDKLLKDDLWKKISPTWEEFCLKAFSHPSYYVDMIRAGVRLLDKGDGKPISAEDAKKAVMAAMVEKVPPLKKNGANQHIVSAELPIPLGEKRRGHRRGSGLPRPSGENRNSEYLVARIKRDRPDIAERMINGDFKSVNAAAREAGINVRPTVKLGDPQKVAQSIARLQGQEYIEALILALETVREANHST
jgi:hypothetical protein